MRADPAPGSTGGGTAAAPSQIAHGFGKLASESRKLYC